MRLSLVAVLLSFALPAQAAPHFTIWADGAGTLVSVYRVPATAAPFDVVVTLNSDGHTSAAAEWVITWLPEIVPGVFHIGTVSIGAPDFTLCGAGQRSICEPGETLFAFSSCQPASERLELVRHSFLDVTGLIPPDTVITLRGFQPGDSMASSFGGEPGFVDCDDVPIAVSPVFQVVPPPQLEMLSMR